MEEETKRSPQLTVTQPNMVEAMISARPRFSGSRLLSEEYFRQLEARRGQDRCEFICGWGAAFINICITFPINKIMFRQMAYGVKASSAVNQLKGESFIYIYRGLLPPLISKTIAGIHSSVNSFSR